MSFSTGIEELDLLSNNARCVYFRDSWVKRLEGASKNYLEVERKKREKADKGKILLCIHYLIKSIVLSFM